MAVKFSQFTVGSPVSDIDFLVGYKASDNVQIPVGVVGTNTTYSVATAQNGSNETLTLTGSDSSTDVITFTAGSNITLTDDGAGNGFTIASTATGDTYDLNATADGSNVDLNLTSGSGTDNSTVQFTAGTGITLTRTGAQEITFASTATGVPTITVDSFTISNSSTNSITVTSSANPTNKNYIDVYINGVYQAKANFSALAGKTLTLASGNFPNGAVIEAVTTT